ncbi:hypothetical protein LEP1GSC125_2712 [Leptospira mayottensis 200901122]|uniref:Uncharacterized protein n=1 Tax=Leptospira mayottensis 200901122 TaxID=1193010 RepID=A0AA87SX31_9LEPT|nr:hypothetical protein LEP1GSC125_2712 [Leptospira mayottensis 200901122]
MPGVGMITSLAIMSYKGILFGEQAAYYVGLRQGLISRAAPFITAELSAEVIIQFEE